jgi:hypothetical protein
MPLFVVVITRSSEELAKRIEAIPEVNRFKLKDDVWLIDHELTTQAFAEYIGIRKENLGATGIAFPITNYSGRATSSVWEWLKLHLVREDQ